MVYGNIHYKDCGTEVSDKVKACFFYALSHNLAAYEPGRYEIQGDEWFVNIVTYETTAPEERFWEAHRKYLDIHLMIDGEEQIDLNFIDALEQKSYIEEDDFLPLDGKKKASVVIENGDYLVCYPEDAHRTAIKLEKSSAIKKAIFKVKIG